MNQDFSNFLSAFKKSAELENGRVFSMLENIFSMREIGNKTHGDLAEVALAEYIRNFVEGYYAVHTGKEKFRAKKAEEDIKVTNEETKEEILISIKAYGKGPLQLSTDKRGEMFQYLTNIVEERSVTNTEEIKKILSAECFSHFSEVNVLPLIYDEKNLEFKIVTFDIDKAYKSIAKISFIAPRPIGRKKTYPIYKFFDADDKYVLEVRYGQANANALQRGMWTHTENAISYFDNILPGEYKINKIIVELIPKILNLHKDEQQKILKSLPF